MRFRSGFVASSLVAAAVCWASPARADPFSVLHIFGGDDGAEPQAPLLVDGAGNLFGTVPYGGSSGNGAVFELSPTGLVYSFRLLYSFSGHADGALPFGGLVADSSGNLFGVAAAGGDSGKGTVFELADRGSSFMFQRLYSFSGPGDGANPLVGLAIDSGGSFYGVASQGGPSGNGTVFALRPGAGGYAIETLYQFSDALSGINQDGGIPEGTLVVDASGDLFGTAFAGGAFGLGTVFELVRTGASYSFALLHAFTGGDDSSYPAAGLVADASGNLYGTTSASLDIVATGTVFELELQPSTPPFVFRTIYAFTRGDDGAVPAAALTVDGAGNLFGTASEAGDSGAGTIFELARQGSSFDFQTLYAFLGLSDGQEPFGGVTLGSGGKLYGTAAIAGDLGLGTVFAFALPPVAANQVVVAAGGAPVPITLSASDPNLPNAAFDFAIVSPPAHGTLSAINGNTVTYTPAAGFSGSDSFTYTAADDDGTSNPATVSISRGSSSPRRLVPVSTAPPAVGVGPRHP